MSRSPRATVRVRVDVVKAQDGQRSAVAVLLNLPSEMGNARGRFRFEADLSGTGGELKKMVSDEVAGLRSRLGRSFGALDGVADILEREIAPAKHALSKIAVEGGSFSIDSKFTVRVRFADGTKVVTRIPVERIAESAQRAFDGMTEEDKEAFNKSADALRR